MNALLETIFRRIEKGVLVVSAQGVVRFANEAARARLGVNAGDALRNEALLRTLRAAEQGVSTLPLRLPASVTAGWVPGGGCEVEVMWGSSANELVLMMSDSAESSPTRQSLRAMAELINEHCRAPMQSFFSAAELAVEALQARAPADGEARRVVERAVARGKTLANKLAQLTAIAQAAGGAPVASDERIEPRGLLEEAGTRAKELAEPRGMRVFIEGLEHELPAIYGNPQWLGRAVFELIACAIACGTSGSDVLVSVSAGEGVVAVVVRVAGNAAASPVNLNNLNTLNESSLLSFYSARPAEGIYCRSLGIGLSFARWVVERHGGRIAVSDDQHGIAEFAAELPCGMPAEQGGPAASMQTQRYAEDLMRLLSEERSPPGRAKNKTI